MFYVYILKCSDNSFYIGCTNDLDKRFQDHSNGKGAKYTRSRLPLELLYKEQCLSKGDALRREIALKKLSRAKKEAFIKGDISV